MADQNVYPKKNFRGFLQDRPLYLVLLPIFFVLHEYTANYDAVPALESAALCLLFIVISFTFTGISWHFLKNIHKAALMALLIMSYHFFYGAARDLIGGLFPDSFFLRYRFIFPFSILLFAAAFIWLKHRKKPLAKLSVYLTVLLAVLIIVDVGVLSSKVISISKKPAPTIVSKALTPCDTCSKPDIYLIVPDGYSGKEGLKAVFDFDNSTFYNELSRRGFHISQHSKSNYDFTMYSMASLLNLDFITYEKGRRNFVASSTYNEIRDNIATKYLIENGYRFYNLSHFDVEKQPSKDYSLFTPTGVKIITSQTFLSRLQKDFYGDFLKGKFGKALQKKYAYRKINYNGDMLSVTRKIAAEKTNSPKFVYTHLLMPHYPFFFDSKGRPAPLEELEGLHKDSKDDYIEYLQYANRRILELVDHILAVSTEPPVIMVLSDHGFIHPRIKVDIRYNFSNLNAIYLPGGNYDAFYDSMSNVNQFRVMFNTTFGLQIPLAKDTSIYVFDSAEATK